MSTSGVLLPVRGEVQDPGRVPAGRHGRESVESHGLKVDPVEAVGGGRKDRQLRTGDPSPGARIGLRAFERVGLRRQNACTTPMRIRCSSFRRKRTLTGMSGHGRGRRLPKGRRHPGRPGSYPRIGNPQDPSPCGHLPRRAERPLVHTHRCADDHRKPWVSRQSEVPLRGQDGLRGVGAPQGGRPESSGQAYRTAAGGNNPQHPGRPAAEAHPLVDRRSSGCRQLSPTDTLAQRGQASDSPLHTEHSALQQNAKDR